MMSTPDPSQEEVVEALANPDPFVLAKSVQKRIQDSSTQASENRCDITYLWIHVSKEGIGGKTDAKRLTIEQWLNVIDEAAALGVTWLVVTINTHFESYPEVWDICKWAQDTYSMQVGLHTFCTDLNQMEIDQIKQLEPEKTRLFIKKKAEKVAQRLTSEGIRFTAADPQPYGERPNCQGPTKMVFVDAAGVLYTCGLVEGQKEYRLGEIHEGTFDTLLHNPHLPHCVEEHLHRVAQGCDGCPSLIANYIAQDLQCND